MVEAESIRKIAAELHVAVGREAQARSSYAASTKRKEDLDKQLGALRSRIKRLTEVNSVLQDLSVNHSLSEAMESALQENRGSIEAIFARIHSPAEFRGSRDSACYFNPKGKRRSVGTESNKHWANARRLHCRSSSRKTRSLCLHRRSF